MVAVSFCACRAYGVPVPPQDEFSQWLDGHMHGRIEGLSEGFQRGYAAANDEISTLQRAAAEVVHSLADAPVRDAAEDQRQADRRARYWAERRGEQHV